MPLETLLACRPDGYAERARALRRLAERLGQVEQGLGGSGPSGRWWRGQAQQRAAAASGQLRDAVGVPTGRIGAPAAWRTRAPPRAPTGGPASTPTRSANTCAADRRDRTHRDRTRPAQPGPPGRAPAPVLAALVEHGARIRYRTDLNGFHPARDGWRCELLDPIDFDHVERQFAMPPTIRLDRTNDRIDDTANHVMIVGPTPGVTVPGVTAVPGSPAPAPR